MIEVSLREAYRVVTSNVERLC